MRGQVVTPNEQTTSIALHYLLHIQLVVNELDHAMPVCLVADNVHLHFRTLLASCAHLTPLLR